MAPGAHTANQHLSRLQAYPSNLRSQLHATGHVKVTDSVPTGWLHADQLEHDAFSVRTGVDPDGPVLRDEHRRMYSLPTCFNTLLSAVIMAKVRSENLLGNRDLLELRLFVSSAGGPDQDAHCDDNPYDPVYAMQGSEDDAMLSGILAIEEGTELLFFPDGPQGAPLRVDLAPGEMLLFRGDCWHAGAGYTTKNRRIHFYLSSPQRRRVPGYSFPYVLGS